MKRKKIYLLVVLTIFLSSVWELPSFLQNLNAEDDGGVTIIANKSIGIDEISTKDLRKIFLGKKTTCKNGEKFVIVLLDNPKLNKKFLKIIGKTPSQYKNYWKKLVFTGKGKGPLMLQSEEELIEYVAKTKGAIAYISRALKNDNIKILTIKSKEK